METLVIHPVDEAQQQALQVILDGFKVQYEKEPITDPTDYLISTKANKERLDNAIHDYKAGKGVAIKIEDLWK
jgi:hypothetical protein